MKLISKILLLSSGVLMLGLGACKKSYLNRIPTDEVPMSDAFKTTTGCKAALEGIHSLMFQVLDHDEFGQKSIDLINDLMGDDMPVSGSGAGWFVSYANYSDPRSGRGYIWSYYYKIVLNCNEILANIDSATGPQADKDNIKGQVYFYLAFAYYNLSIYYQHTYALDPTAPGVPIYHTPTQTANPRASLEDVYKEITSDLRKAEVLLNPANGAPVRGNKSEINIDVVQGLHARVAMVMQNWSLADSMAGAARQNYPYMSAHQLLDGFNDWGNPAWIWGSYLNEEQNGIYASFLSQMDISLGGYAAYGMQKMINKSLYNIMPHDSASAGGYDIRRDWWYVRDESPSKKFAQKKFRALTPGSFSSDVIYMRAAEMGFIQAEAKAHEGDISGAQNELQKIMVIRNPMYDASLFTTQNALLIEIWHQRRIELWGEGFRFSDLQRCAALPAAVGTDGFGKLFYSGLHRENSGGEATVYGTFITITSPIDNRFLFKIPTSELNYNSGMVQNP